MSCPTKAFHHTGTSSPTNIGPASGGILHSITVNPASGTSPPTVIVKDGATTIFQLDAGQFRFNGIKLSGQLNLTLNNDNSKVTVEMSQEL